ncbi:hypothetical protein V8E54_004831 [Elaphomyces granulatus]
MDDRLSLHYSSHGTTGSLAPPLPIANIIMGQQRLRSARVSWKPKMLTWAKRSVCNLIASIAAADNNGRLHSDDPSHELNMMRSRMVVIPCSYFPSYPSYIDANISLSLQVLMAAFYGIANITSLSRYESKTVDSHFSPRCRLSQPFLTLSALYFLLQCSACMANGVTSSQQQQTAIVIYTPKPRGDNIFTSGATDPEQTTMFPARFALGLMREAIHEIGVRSEKAQLVGGFRSVISGGLARMGYLRVRPPVF